MIRFPHLFARLSTEILAAWLCLLQLLAGYYHTQGNRIVDEHGVSVRFNGINWFGFETANFCPHGLWSRSLNSMLDQMQALGYNLLRVPYCNEMFNAGVMPNSINFFENPDLQGLTPIQVLDQLVERAGVRGMKIMLDRHRPTSAGQSELWYTASVTEQRWIDDWKMLAQRYATDDTVIAADLHNEPHGPATWGSGVINTDWRLAAERCGNAILSVNPNWLIVVEGVENYQGDFIWWGGNLKGAGTHPVRLNVANRLVYSPHDYGPGAFAQTWFNDSSFPANLPGIYHTYWAYLHHQNFLPIFVSEFGGKSVDTVSQEGIWQNFLVDYLATNQMYWTYWCWNPNSGDTGGVLNDDWMTINRNKQNMLNRLLNAPPPPPLIPPAAPTNLTALALSPSRVHLTWTDLASNEDSFRVERSSDGTNFSEVIIAAANVTSCTNLGLAAQTTYYYRVRATNGAGASAYAPTVAVTTSAPPPAAPAQLQQILWGMGDQPGAAITRPLFTNAPVKMITAWYNGPGDLGWMSGYTNNNFMSGRYGMGNCFEVVVWLANHQSYATNGQVLADLRTLARIFKGQGPNYGPAYFVLFTELETYAGAADTNYWTALRSNYLAAVDVIHQEHPQAHVALGFGGYGWLGQGERDLSFWEPAIAASDFTASQAMTSAKEAVTMKAMIRRAVRQLGRYCKPVMISHFKIWSTLADTNVVGAFDSFLAEAFTDREVADLLADGLFGWGWMDDRYIRDPGPTFDSAVQLVTRFASTNLTRPPRTDCAPLATVVVDNADATGVAISGAWIASSSTPGYCRTNYLHDDNTGPTGGKSVGFIPTLPQSGRYDAYLRWTAHFNRAANVLVDIYHADGTNTFTVNQQGSGGSWVWAGKFNFNGGTNGRIVLRNDGANGYVIADAVKFELFTNPLSWPAPPSIISSGWNPNGQFVMNLAGDTNATYAVWATTNLLDWESLGNAAPLGDGRHRFLDPSPGDWPRRFYRAGGP